MLMERKLYKFTFHRTDEKSSVAYHLMTDSNEPVVVSLLYIVKQFTLWVFSETAKFIY